MTDRHEDSDEDTYVMVGAAFDPLETPEDVQRAKVLKEKEQYVTDSQGRRRFHGAFTGGFSAGYYNTVGTKEGWTPSTFISSRGKKAEHGPQKPEDFMDEEDFDTHGIAPREVAAKDEFSRDGLKAGSRRPQPSQSRPSVIPGEPPLQNLIVPTQSTIGAQLLKAMGWREGEGVGPKVVKYPARPHKKTKVYGCAMPGVQEEEEDPSYPQGAEGFQFAPHDVTPWQFEGKEDMHGIGYRGMEEQEVLRAQKSTKALYGMSGEAFGIGALEEGDDEDDVYGTETMTSYDVTLAGEGDITMERKYGWTGGQDSDSWSLSSFTKTSKSTQQHKKFPPPMVPRDFVPLHKFTALVSIKAAPVESHQKPLSSTERTHMLADKPGSVFSLMAAEDRERLRRTAELAKQGILPHPADAQPHPPAPQPRPTHSQNQGSKPGAHLSGLHTHSTSSSNSSKFTLENLKPFASNPAKQGRYEAYLAGRRDSSGSEYSNMTEWECQREREEFARAARVQQPLTTSSLASRFTKEQGEGQGEGPREGETRRSESPESDAVQAARAGMFGVLTREVVEWQPHKLLCKRFNVPDPYPSRGVVGEEKRPSATRTVAFLQTETMASQVPEMPAPVGTTGGVAGHTQAEGPPSVSSGDSSVVGSEASSTAVSARSEDGTNDGEGVGKAKAETEMAQPSRPPMDLFKAIFAESSESSESEHGDSDMETETTAKTAADTRTTAVATESRTGNRGGQPHDRNTSQGTSDSGDFQQKRWQDFSLIANRPAAAPSEPKPHLSLPRAPSNRETGPAPLRQSSQAETRRDGQEERNVVERDGGVRDGSVMDRGSRDGGVRNEGAKDRDVRDRRVSDGSARDRSARDRRASDGGARDRSARDRGETRTEKMAYGPTLPPQVHSASDSESSPDTSQQRKSVRKHSTYKHHKKHKKTKREGHKEHKKSKHKH